MTCVTLSPDLGGLGISSLKDELPLQYAASVSITKSHVESIPSQNKKLKSCEPSIDDFRNIMGL